MGVQCAVRGLLHARRFLQPDIRLPAPELQDRGHRHRATRCRWYDHREHDHRAEHDGDGRRCLSIRTILPRLPQHLRRDRPGKSWLHLVEQIPLTFPSDSCIIRSCGFDNYEYCYENSEDRWYTYQSLQPVPTTIAFLWGQMLTGDRIVVYNGRNRDATVIYQGSNGGNLSGFAVNSRNTEHIITLRIQSNATGSCDDGQATVPLRWTVGCGAVGIDDVSPTGFSVFPNPTEGVLYISVGSEVTGNARVRVLDMSGRQVFDEPMNLRASNTSSIDMRGLQTGQYLIQLVTSQWTKVQRVQVARLAITNQREAPAKAGASSIVGDTCMVRSVVEPSTMQPTDHRFGRCAM